MKHPANTAAKRQREAADSAIMPVSNGFALFLAISLLALFSILGASYMRYMSLERDESDMRVRNMRARQYAAAGIRNAAGQIFAAVASGQSPAQRHNFPFTVYFGAAEEDEQELRAYATYFAEADTTITPLDQNAWASRFPEHIEWPGKERAYHVISDARLQRAVPGRIHTIARHAVEAVLVVGDNGCDTVLWGAYKDDGASEQTETVISPEL